MHPHAVARRVEPVARRAPGKPRAARCSRSPCARRRRPPAAGRRRRGRRRREATAARRPRASISASRSQSSRGSPAYVPCTLPIETARQATLGGGGEPPRLLGIGERASLRDRGDVLTARDVTELGLDRAAESVGAAPAPRGPGRRSRSNGDRDPSAITAPAPSSNAAPISSRSETWSSCTQARAGERSAAARSAGQQLVAALGARTPPRLISRTTPRRGSAAASSTARATSRS